MNYFFYALFNIAAVTLATSAILLISNWLEERTYSRRSLIPESVFYGLVCGSIVGYVLTTLSVLLIGVAILTGVLRL